MGVLGQGGISLMYPPVVDLHHGPVLSVHGFVGDTRVYIYIIVHFEPRDHPFCSVPNRSGGLTRSLEMMSAKERISIDEAQLYMENIHIGKNVSPPYQRLRELVALARSIVANRDVHGQECDLGKEVLEGLLKLSETIQETTQQDKIATGVVQNTQTDVAAPPPRGPCRGGVYCMFYPMSYFYLFSAKL